MDFYMMPWKKFAEFGGRAQRAEYWWFTLINGVIGIVANVLIGVLAGVSDAAVLAGSGIYLLFGLATLIPSLAVTIRRLHDTGKSGWLFLVGLIPFIGGLILLVFMCQDSERGGNQWGPSPKYQGEVAAQVFE